MLLEVAIVAVVLISGNVAFRHFNPRMRLWRRLLKTFIALAITALLSHFVGRTGVVIGFSIAMALVIFIHGIWLPRQGVNGWTGEPREKYYALRGWPPPGSGTR
jgi:hypothetical protein